MDGVRKRPAIQIRQFRQIARVVTHPALRDLPFYLETPNDLDGYAAEIAQLKKLAKAK